MANDELRITNEGQTIYMVKQEAYEGPFDLLLEAINEGKLEIHQISLSRITSEYLERLKQIKELNIILSSDFLVMAAQLVELKSRSLLPVTINENEEEMIEDLEQSLVDHIAEYQVFKQAAQTLRQRKEIFENIYGRHEGEQLEHEIVLKDVSLKDLVEAFKKIFDEINDEDQLVPIEFEEIKIEDKIEWIKEKIRLQPEGVGLSDLLVRRTRLEVVVTFLAILELVRQKEARIIQGATFGSIAVKGVEKENGGTEDGSGAGDDGPGIDRPFQA